MTRTKAINRRARTRKGGLYGQVVDSVGQAIIDGVMEPGDVVFADQLCEELGVSRSVVREGLRTLSSLGLVEARPQVGTRVLDMSSWNLLDPSVVMWRAQSSFHARQMIEVLEFRYGIEPVAALLAADRISDEQAGQLIDAAQQMSESFQHGDRVGFFAADAVFHRMILIGSQNPVMAQFADTVQATLQTRLRDARSASTELNAVSLECHVKLAAAVRRRSGTKAEHLAKQIIEETLRELSEATQ